MTKNIRFSEWRLGSDAGKKTIAMATNKGEGSAYNEAVIKKAALACDVYVAFEGHKNDGVNTSQTTDMETVAEDLFDQSQDFRGNDKATQAQGKDYSKGKTQKYAKDLPLSSYNKRTGAWDMEKALTTGEKVLVSTNDPLYERTALNNEIILINTLTYLSGKTAKPKVLARPAFEYNGELTVSDEPMSLSLITTYFNVYFSYVVRVAMYDITSPYNSTQGAAKKAANKKDLQQRYMDKAAEKGYDVNPDKDWDKATLKDGMNRRKYGVARVLGIDPDQLNLSWFFSLSSDFLVNGFWEAVESGSALKKTRQVKDKKTGEIIEVSVEKDSGTPEFQTNKGVLLDDKFQNMISSVDSLLDAGFSIDYYEDTDTDLMNWIANALRLRFNYYKKVLFSQAAREYKTAQASSLDAMADELDDKSGSSRLERELYKAGQFTDSPEEEIAINQSIDKFFQKEKYWLTDEVDGFNDTYPILRYMAAMIEYPCSSSATILNIVGTGHINNGSKHINNWGSIFTADRPAPKGSLSRLSIEVVKKLEKYDLVQLFMGLINTFRGDAYRVKILNELHKIYVDFEGAPEPTATIPLTFKIHTQSEVEAVNKKGCQRWFLVDSLFIQRCMDRWDKYCEPLVGTEYEKLIEDGENMILDACEWNKNSIVASFFYSPANSIFRKVPEVRELLDGNAKKLSDEEKASRKKFQDLENEKRNKEVSDTFFGGQGVPAYVKPVNSEEEEKEEGSLDESLFSLIHKNYMKNKLFETVYNNAKKRS